MFSPLRGTTSYIVKAVIAEIASAIFSKTVVPFAIYAFVLETEIAIKIAFAFMLFTIQFF